MPRATRLIIAAAVAGGALTLLVAAWRQPASAHLGVSQWVVAVTMGVLVLGSWVWPVVVFRGGESEAFHLDEGFFVILALLVPPLLTLGTLAAATILGSGGEAACGRQVGLQLRADADRGRVGAGREPR